MSYDEERNSELKDNAESINIKIITLEQELNSIAGRDYKHFWEGVKDINVLFKNTRLESEDREYLWKLHCSICEKAKNIQEEKTKKAITTIESELSTLGFYSFIEPYGDFWKKSKEIPTIFKRESPLPKEERTRLWEKYQSLCERVKKDQADKYNKRIRASEQKKSNVLDLIKDAHFQTQGSRDMRELQNARNYLNKALEVMKDNYVGDSISEQLFRSEIKLTKQDREICWKKWTSVSDEIRYKREDIWKSNYNHLISIAGNAVRAAECDDLREARNLVKSVHNLQKSKPVNDSQYKDIQSVLQRAWDIAAAKSEKKREDFSRLVDNKIKHHTDQINDLESRIAHHRRQIDACYDKIRSAYNENHIRMIENEWIPEHERKISQFQSYIREHENQLCEWKSKI
ncbi:hypothetical protein [Methanoplanus limicola]|uniref:Uncharacterized protein n=1 Tax=Methanoplanus limicola DSM 2279 TaxID=937775 RepID=H1Z1M5_9EURY|nr:hypothetical protein [Methanoplanus limicola]EHQ34551.1 hypothetical protein Metlim_0412 [Methanoplanus limicola DSM 2279]